MNLSGCRRYYDWLFEENVICHTNKHHISLFVAILVHSCKGASKADRTGDFLRGLLPSTLPCFLRGLLPSTLPCTTRLVSFMGSFFRHDVGILRFENANLYELLWNF